MGSWETKTTDIRRFPTDFTSATEGYKETVKYMATEVPMFGTPSVNYTYVNVMKLIYNTTIFKIVEKHFMTEFDLFSYVNASFRLSGVNLNDPNDIHTSVGFLTLKPGTSPLKTFLMTTNNEGKQSYVY